MISQFSRHCDESSTSWARLAIDYCHLRLHSPGRCDVSKNRSPILVQLFELSAHAVPSMPSRPWRRKCFRPIRIRRTIHCWRWRASWRTVESQFTRRSRTRPTVRCLWRWWTIRSTRMSVRKCWSWSRRGLMRSARRRNIDRFEWVPD